MSKIRIEIQGQSPQLFDSLEKAAEYVIELQVPDSDDREVLAALLKQQRTLLGGRAHWNAALAMYQTCVEAEYEHPIAVVQCNGHKMFKGPKDALAMIEGSFSIKNVLPAFVQDLSYDDLGVRDGDTAVARFSKLARGKYTQAQSAGIRKELLEYCALDTLAMVRLHFRLTQLTGESGR